MKYLDQIFDVIIYSLTALCFIGAGVLIVQTLMNDVNHLIESSVLIVLGIGTSLYFVWIKSKSTTDKPPKF